MPGLRVVVGSAAGAVAAGLAARLIRPFFHPPTGGVGFVTVNGYAKGYDYALVISLALGAMAGGLIAAALWREISDPSPEPRTFPRRAATFATAAVVFVLMLFIHDHPYALMDHFHEGEHLTPGYLFQGGARPYSDVFVLHGLATDGGLDSLVLGHPPSPRRARRLETVLDAATLALLVPIAAELCATNAGLIAAVLASLCGMAAGQLPVFPYYRLAPVLLAALGLLRYARKGGAGNLFTAFAASTLGVLWSLDTGSYALAATVMSFVILRATKSEANSLPWSRVAILAIAALMLPAVLLLIAGAGLPQFLIDSFVIIPRAIDAVWSLPAPPAPELKQLWKWLDSESARFYLPPIAYGTLIAGAISLRMRGDRASFARLLIVAIASLFVFRTALGRVAWSHTRYGVPLFGIAVVAFAVEPLWRAKRWIGVLVLSLALAFVVELRANVVAAGKFIAGWRSRQSHAGLVPYPFATGKGIYTNPENASDLAALNGFIETLGPPEMPILDFSNERALYYLLRRKPPVRCFDIPMLSAPPLREEAMRELASNPPVCVIVEGIDALWTFDGVSNAARVPDLARWIDEHYPRRHQIGRFVVATP